MAKIAKTAEETKQAEREWHDAEHRLHAASSYPGGTAEFVETFKRVDLTDFCEGGWSYWGDSRAEALKELANIQGMNVLDYGCGSGRLGIYLTLRGANVWAFDLSAEGIKVAQDAARQYGVLAKFEQMDAEDLRYPDDFFDLVIGFGVLHHVIKYAGAASHLRRVLKPGGRAVFIETLWDNPLINFARRFTTVDAGAGDTRLTEMGICKFAREFEQVCLEKRNFLYMLKRLAKLPERNLAEPLRPRGFWRAVKSADKVLLRSSLLRRYCGEVIVWLRK